MLLMLCLLSTLILGQGSNVDRIAEELNQLSSEHEIKDDEKPLETKVTEDFTLIKDWPTVDILDSLGQVSGLSFNSKGYLYIFHRADRKMNENSYDENNIYIFEDEGAIKSNTILQMNNKIRDPYIVFGFGDNLFYLPHGIFVDENYVWTTDVALHQVFRFLHGSKIPDLILGERFIPGNDKFHFCKPTHAVTSSDGRLFVADGYCNSRIVMFDKTGKYIMQFGDQKGDGKLNLPHHLAMVEIKDLICAADRENNRILCYNAGIRKENIPGKLKKVISDARFGPIYAIALNIKENMLYIVSGITYEKEKSRVFLYNWNDDIITGAIKFSGPNGFGLAHTISVCQEQKYVAIGSLTKECSTDTNSCLEREENDERFVLRNIWLYGLRNKRLILE